MNKNTLSILIKIVSIIAVTAGSLALSVSNSGAYPSIFPNGVTINNPEKTYEGFTLYTPSGGETGKDKAHEVYLINMNGDIVHTWKVDNTPRSYGYLLGDGTLLYAGKTKESEELTRRGSGDIIQEIDWEGNTLWEYRNKRLHHDFEKLPNGNLLVLIREPMKPENIKSLLGNEDNFDSEIELTSDAILEIDYKTKEIVWEWHAENKLDFEKYPYVQNLDFSKEWLHVNAIENLTESNPFNGRESILLSLAFHDSIIAIDKQTGEVTWEWGPGIIVGQHDPTVLPNGNLLVFDNRGGWLGSSRVVEVEPTSKKIVWEYAGEGMFGSQFYSSIISGAQRLPNGNTLITEGLTGRIFEVTKGKLRESVEFGEVKFANEIVWEYINPHYSPAIIGNGIYRAYRYGLNDINWPQNMPIPDPEAFHLFSFIKSITDSKDNVLLTLLIVSVATNIFLWHKRSKKLLT